MGLKRSPVSPAAGEDEAVLAIIEALRGYFAARRREGLSRDELARRWYAEQLIRPSPEHVDRALRFMEKTLSGHARIPGTARAEPRRSASRRVTPRRPLP